MAGPSYDRLRELTDMIETEPCTEEENRRFAEMLKNGEQLPEWVAKSAQDDKIFFHIKELIPPEKEQMYVLMRISKDLHFISTLVGVMLTLGIISALAALLFGLIN